MLLGKDDGEAQQTIDLIGAIYDCALDPDRWSETLGRIATALNCEVGSLTRLDRKIQRLVAFVLSPGVDPYWMAMHIEQNYALDALAFFSEAMAAPQFDIDTPLVLSRDVPSDMLQNLRVMKEWAEPQGFCDCMSVVVLDTPARLGTVDMIRHRRVGPADDPAIAMFALLAPHLRRAVTVADMFGLKKLEAAALAQTVDLLAQPVLLVDERNRIIFANAAATDLLDAGRLIRTVNGTLMVGSPAETAHLRLTIDGVAAKTMPSQGMTRGIPLTPSDSDVAEALAYVLPLNLGEIGRGSKSRWIAAVVIARRDTSSALNLDAMSAAYGLTVTEVRLLTCLAAGDSLTNAAGQLGIEITTARTHLARLFAKTATSRQAELVAVAVRLAAPIRVRGGAE